MPGGGVSVSRRSRPHRLGARVDAEQSSLLTLRPTSTFGAARGIGCRVLAYGAVVVIVEGCGNTASGPVSAVNAVVEKVYKFNIKFLFRLRFVSSKEKLSTYVYAGCGTEIDFVSNFLLLSVSKVFSNAVSKFLRICRRDGRRVNAGGIRLIFDASFDACRSVLPLLGERRRV